MAGTIITSDYEFNEALADTDLIEVFQPSSGGIRREKKGLLSSLKSFFQADIKNGTEQLNPRSFISGRFDSQEFTSGTLNTSGWYTLAESNAESNGVYDCDFDCITTGGSSRRGVLSGKIKHIADGVLVFDSQAEITGKANSNGNFYIEGFRLVKSESVASAGIKVQIKLSIITTLVMTIQKRNNIATLPSASSEGLKLVTPYLDNTPTLPDGVTVGTFLEAGEELSFETSVTIFARVIGASRSSDDAISCTAKWDEIPKQGTTLTLSLPTTLQVVDGSGLARTISGLHTISNLIIRGKTIEFLITEVGAFTTLNAGELRFEVTGSGCQLTIT